ARSAQRDAVARAGRARLGGEQRVGELAAALDVEQLPEPEDAALRGAAELEQSIAELARARRRHQEERAAPPGREAALEVRAQEREHVLRRAAPLVHDVREIAAAAETGVGDGLGRLRGIRGALAHEREHA